MTADPTNAVRKQRLRKARKDAGLQELRVYVPQGTLDDLEALKAIRGGDTRSNVVHALAFMAMREKLLCS